MINWNALQMRAVDPYSSYKSSNVNRVSYLLSFDGRGIASGLVVTISDPTTLQITQGVALKDNVTLRWAPTFLLPISETTGSWVVGDNWVVMVYKFIETKIEDYKIAKIDVVPIADYDPEWHLILARVTIDGSGNFVSIDSNPPERPSIDFGSHNNLPGLQGGNPALNQFYHLELCDWQNVHSCCWYVPGAFITIDGSVTPCCDISWDNNKLTDLADPTSGGDAVNLQTLNTCIGCAGGATQFIQLTDTPAAYCADCWLKVNGAANALEFVSAPTGGSQYLSTLCDVSFCCPDNGAFLTYNCTSGMWVDTLTVLEKLQYAGDVNSTGLADGCILKYKTDLYGPGSHGWCPAPPAAVGTVCFTDLCDGPGCIPSNNGCILISSCSGTSISWADPYAVTVPALCCVGDVWINNCGFPVGGVPPLAAGHTIVWNGAQWNNVGITGCFRDDTSAYALCAFSTTVNSLYVQADCNSAAVFCVCDHGDLSGTNALCVHAEAQALSVCAKCMGLCTQVYGLTAIYACAANGTICAIAASGSGGTGTCAIKARAVNYAIIGCSTDSGSYAISGCAPADGYDFYAAGPGGKIRAKVFNSEGNNGLNCLVAVSGVNMCFCGGILVSVT